MGAFLGDGAVSTSILFMTLVIVIYKYQKLHFWLKTTMVSISFSIIRNRQMFEMIASYKHFSVV